MRKRFKRDAVCSSKDYRATRKSHLDYLKESHNAFVAMVHSGDIVIDVEPVENSKITVKFKTVRVFGKEIKITIEEFNLHNTLNTL